MKTQTVRNIPVHKIACEILEYLNTNDVLGNNPGLNEGDLRAVCDWMASKIGSGDDAHLRLADLGGWVVRWSECLDPEEVFRRDAPTAADAAIGFVRTGEKDGSLQNGEVVRVDVRPVGESGWTTFTIKATCQWSYEILNQPNEITKGDQEPSQVDSVTPEEGIRLLNTLTMSRRGLNPEDAHREADAVLLGVLCGLGATSVAAAFRYARDEIGFWYA